MSDHPDSKNAPADTRIAKANTGAGLPFYRTGAHWQGTRRLPPVHGLARQGSRKRRPQVGRRGNEWAWVIAAGALMAAFAFAILVVLFFMRFPLYAQEITPTAEAPALPTPVDARIEFRVDDRKIGVDILPLPDGQIIELQPWDGQSRFTVIVAGLDRRPGETGLEFRTDSMMLISLDPTAERIGILSIPRDLYVQIPGWQQYRINAALYLGEARGEGFGPTLLMQTIQLNFGIRVHDYALVDFQAFIDIVDLIGGVDIAIDYTLDDPRYPDMTFGYDPFYLEAGTHHLDGYDALRFARTRHGNNDIRRAERQQQILFAFRDRLLSLETIPQLIVQAPVLWETLSDNVYTGLSLEQIIRLAIYAKDIERENIKTGIINFRYLEEYVTEAGQHVLVPLREPLGGLMREVFGPDYYR